MKGIFKRCIHSLSESCTMQCLQKQKPDNKHVRVKDPVEPTSQPLQSHRQQDSPVLAPPDSWVWSCPVATLFVCKKKKKNCFLGNLPCNTDQTEVLTSHSRVQGDPTTSSVQCCSCLRPWEMALTFKRWVHSSSRLILNTQIGGVSSWRGGLFRWCHPDDLGCEHDSLVSALRVAISVSCEELKPLFFTSCVLGM